MKLKNISKSYADIIVLNDLTITLNKGEKYALIGPNGVGKSTLLKIIAGIEEPDSGEIEKKQDMLISYVPQEIEIDSKDSVVTYIKRIVGIEEIEKRLQFLESRLDSEDNLQEYYAVQERYMQMDGYNFDSKLSRVLSGLGLDSVSMKREVSSLSGGQKSKVNLAGVLLLKPDLILLDEPTNNLDISSIVWLEEYLSRTTSTCLIVSHDRRFIDKVVRRVVVMDWFTRKAEIFTGSYSDYMNYVTKEADKLKRKHEEQQEEIAKMKDNVRQKKMWALSGSKQVTSDKDKYIRGHRRDKSSRLAKQAKSVEKKIEKLPEIKLIRTRDELEISIDPTNIESKYDIMLKDVVVEYPESDFCLGPVSLDIRFGARLCIVGDNGSGKSSLLKVIAGEIIPKSGEVVIGKSVVQGNLMQAHENMNRDLILRQFFKEHGVTDRQKVLHMLSKYYIAAGDIEKKINDFSPGERSRVLFALFSLLSVNLLVLDEPTNHLDLDAVEALERVVKNYSGTVIVVTHDRQFIESIKPGEMYLLENNQLVPISNYEDYMGKISKKVKRKII